MQSPKLLINLPPDLKSWLRSAAAAEGVSMGEYIRRTLAEKRAAEVVAWFDAPTSAGGAS